MDFLAPDLQLATHAVAAPKPAVDPQLRARAEEFEAMFLSQMVSAMTAGLKTDGPFGGGHAEGVMRSLLNQEFGKAMAAHGGAGIADSVYRELLRLQEV